MKIFLSHNHKDKPVVENVALRLRAIFGEENIFYDSWSIQPGDGVIEEIEHGLKDVEFVFFFNSLNSKESNMVRLEWQNALFKATKGKCKIIPIRLDEEDMPAVLSQTLYLDMYSNGLETTITQIVNVIQGNSSFVQEHGNFSNLSFCIESQTEDEIVLKISASHFLETTVDFAVIIKNEDSDVDIRIRNQMLQLKRQFNTVTLDDGSTANAFRIAATNASLKPKFPIRIHIKRLADVQIAFVGLMHRVSETDYQLLPITAYTLKS